MKTKKHLFLVLVPHRDTRMELQKYSAALFKAGNPCAFHFPWVAPLAEITRPFSAAELKRLAHSLRAKYEKDTDRFILMENRSIPFPADADGTKLFGPRLDFTLSTDIFENNEITKIKKWFSETVIGCSLGNAPHSLPPLQKLSFRAAAVANMYWQPLGKNTDGYKWKIGSLYWLPKRITQTG
ncbi:MAG: hypothetical protein LBU66_05630 [Treponema sp.]|nr:hypothetical protein [Treponema sp.]